MASFSELPAELVEHLASYLEQPALCALSRLTSSLYKIVIPLLYRHIDLLITPGDRLPRIDRLCFNILNDPRLGKYVRSLRIGLSSRDGVRGGQRFLPNDNEAQQRFILLRSMELLEKEALVSGGEDVRASIGAREYGAYAALLFLLLPSLHRLDLADRKNETLRPLHSVIFGIFRNADQWASHSPDLAARIASIRHMSYNFDSDSGMRYKEKDDSSKVWVLLALPMLRKLEFPNTDTNLLAIFEPSIAPPIVPRTFRTTHLTTMVIRHSSQIWDNLDAMLQGTPHLGSLTCELWYDSSIRSLHQSDPSWTWISLQHWTQSLRKIRSTLKTLVLSVEFYNGEELYYKQPDIRKHVTGQLDLREFTALQELEVPLPFISGDSSFWFALEFEPLLPPDLRHLSLRSDMSRAQSAYPFDTSIMSQMPSLQDSQLESNYLVGARMDMSCIYQNSLSLIDTLRGLHSITVWQPPDHTLHWFQDQFDEFATTCRNKSIGAKVICPQLLRKKAAAHWDLVQEVTLYDPSYPNAKRFKRLIRSERNGIPLGLAAQYHLGEYKKRHVRRYR